MFSDEKVYNPTTGSDIDVEPWLWLKILMK
jgi:hypothetical protein